MPMLRILVIKPAFFFCYIFFIQARFCVWNLMVGNSSVCLKTFCSVLFWSWIILLVIDSSWHLMHLVMTNVDMLQGRLVSLNV